MTGYIMAGLFITGSFGLMTIGLLVWLADYAAQRDKELRGCT